MLARLLKLAGRGGMWNADEDVIRLRSNADADDRVESVA